MFIYFTADSFSFVSIDKPKSENKQHEHCPELKPETEDLGKEAGLVPGVESC